MINLLQLAAVMFVTSILHIFQASEEILMSGVNPQPL